MLVRKLLPAIAIAVVAVCLSEAALAVDGGRSRHTISQTSRWWRSATQLKSTMRATSWKPRSARTLAAGRDPYADPAAPYKANRLSSPPALPIVNIPSQTTVLTRRVLDDKNATSVGDALRTTPGVTVGR
jgi:outer membrane receptor for ferric coprogen and ferric-rhodotorulic acid